MTAQTTPETPETDEPTQAGTDLSPAQSEGLVAARDRYRGERDAARGELTAATARIELLNRREVERVAAESLAMPADFWLSGNAVADYLTETGDVDTERVREDARLLLAERPTLGNRVLAHDPTIGSGNASPAVVNRPTWGSLLT